MERLPSGVKGLDELIEGGIPKGFTVAAVGEPGTGKTVFSIQFTATGLARGEKCIYVTTEESRESIINQAARLGFDFEEALRRGSLVIIDALMWEYGDLWSIKELNVEELISKVMEAKKYLGHGHTRLVVDSMSAFWLDKPVMARKYSYMLKRSLARWDLTIVATAQYAVTSALGFGFGIEHVADGILRLRKAIISGVLKRLLIIEKMRQTNHDRRVFEVEVRNGEGLVIVKPVEISGDALRRLSPSPYFEEGELRF